MRTVLLLLCTTQLAGCWFVFIPGSMISGIADSLGGYEGRHCIGESAKVGDRIKFTNGSTGVVKKLEGPSSRCQGQWPIRALVHLDPADGVAAQ